LIDAVAPTRAGARKGRARLVGTLLMGWRIFVGENLLGLQVGKLFIAVVAEEQRLASIADENHGIMGDCELIHVSLLKRRPRRLRACRGVHHQRPRLFSALTPINSRRSNGRRTAAYSAAARVCPSRRLSVSRSASAASAINGPGGKTGPGAA